MCKSNLDDDDDDIKMIKMIFQISGRRDYFSPSNGDDPVVPRMTTLTKVQATLTLVFTENSYCNTYKKIHFKFHYFCVFFCCCFFIATFRRNWKIHNPIVIAAVAEETFFFNLMFYCQDNRFNCNNQCIAK